ncbi:MAG: hypothetical protein EAX96_12380 [Candidatus Lokiarchaeota archaeon]|nr:hypothetical protein [Candidatus Lokiarchaeota archaeon]
MIEKNNKLTSLEEACCNHKIILNYSTGEYVCCKCGLVTDKQYVNSSFKMTNYDSQSKFNSSKHYVALGDRINVIDGMGSYIDYQYSNFFVDKNGQPISCKNQSLFKRLKYKHDIRAKLSNKETDFRALNTLNKIASKLELKDNIRDRAAYFYQKIIRNEMKITNHLTLAALCLLLAAREFKENGPLTVQEIANTFKKYGHRVSPRSIIQLSLKIKPEFPNIFNKKSRKSEEYMPRIISNVMNFQEIKSRLKSKNIDLRFYERNLLNESMNILKNLDNKSRGGRNPFILAVATVYAADQKISEKYRFKSILTQNLLSRCTQTAEYSIRDHWRTLLVQFIKNKK